MQKFSSRKYTELLIFKYYCSTHSNFKKQLKVKNYMLCSRQLGDDREWLVHYARCIVRTQETEWNQRVSYR
jgi:hypothetical protein